MFAAAVNASVLSTGVGFARAKAGSRSTQRHSGDSPRRSVSGRQARRVTTVNPNAMIGLSRSGKTIFSPKAVQWIPPNPYTPTKAPTMAWVVETGSPNRVAILTQAAVHKRTARASARVGSVFPASSPALNVPIMACEKTRLASPPTPVHRVPHPIAHR